MSLINQLLKDLERRHAAGAEIKGIGPQARSLPERRRNPAMIVGFGLLGIAGILLAFGIYQWQLRVPHVPAGPSQVNAAGEAAEPQRLPGDTVAQPAPAVEDALLAPVFQLAEELSYVPQPRAEKPSSSGKRPSIAKPAPAKLEQKAAPAPAAPAPGPVEERAAAAPASSSVAVQPAVPQSAPLAAPPRPRPSQAEPIEEIVIAADLPSPPIEKQTRMLTAYERAENEFREGVARLRQGRLADAEAGFRAALREDRSHVSARQALIGLLIDSHRSEDAEQALKESLNVNPRQPRYAMLLARLELDRGDAPAAVKTLESVKSYAGADAEFYAFYAAALQRAGRHAEAADQYRSALAISPGNAVWQMGYGISLRASGQRAEAQQAFRRAADSRTLNQELQSFVEAQYQELSTRPR